MFYDTSSQFDLENLKNRLDYLIKNGKKVELKEVLPRRSINQNSYLHLLLCHYAMETGNTLEWVKIKYFKELLNKDIFFETKNDSYLGETFEIKSTSDLDTATLSRAIDRFIYWSEQECGIYMPRIEDKLFLDSIYYESKKQSKYL